MNTGFLYPISPTKWVSNPIPIDKNQGIIHVCTDLCDLNKVCPKDNYPMPFINHIIEACAHSEVFSFMDGFSVYNQIQIKPKCQHKTDFICPWGTFTYKKIPFDLKNSRATFQRAMKFSFHDIKNIVEPYLDNFPAHSHNRRDHPDHLCMIFE